MAQNPNKANPESSIPLEQRLVFLFDVERVLVDPQNIESFYPRCRKTYVDMARIVLESKKRGITVCAVSSSDLAEDALKDVDFRYLAHITENKYWDQLKDKSNYLDVFDAAALGTKKCWHKPNVGTPAEEMMQAMHYSFARGTATQAYWTKHGNRSIMPDVVVFEDGKECIKEIAPYDFICIGVERASPQGDLLTTRGEFLAKGAHLAYEEKDLKSMPYDHLLADIARFTE